MSEEKYILVRKFCDHHHITLTFIQRLEEQGMIEVIRKREEAFLPDTVIERLEKMVRLHQDLDIHTDDLDVVSDLLERINSLQEELDRIHRRLTFYEQQF